MMMGLLCHKIQPSEPPFHVVLIEAEAESQQMTAHEMVLDHHKLALHVHTFDHDQLAPVDIAEAFAVDFAAVVGVAVADETGGAAGEVAVAVDRAAVVDKTVVADKVVVVDRAAVDKPLAVVVVDYKAVAVADRGVVAVADKALTVVVVVDRALAIVVVDKTPTVAAADKALTVAGNALAVAVVDKAAIVVVDKAVAVVDTVVAVDRTLAVVVHKAVVVDKVAVDDMVAAVVDKAVAIGSLVLAAVDSAVGMVAADHTERVLVGEALGEEAVEGVALDHSFHFELGLVVWLVAQVPAKVQPLVLHGQPCRSKYTLKP